MELYPNRKVLTVKFKTTLKIILLSQASPTQLFFFFFLRNNPLPNQAYSTTAKEQIANEMEAGAGAMDVSVLNPGSRRQEKRILEESRKV